MEQVVSISQKDIGRVAQTKDAGFGKGYRIRILDLVGVTSDGKVHVHAEELDTIMEYTAFTIIGGHEPLYWVEDPAKKLDYPQMTLDISTAVHASRHVNQPRDVFQVMAYLASETGECADWLVNPDRQKESLYGECVDVIICALDLALTHKKQTTGLDGQKLADEVIADLNDLLKIKAEKWLDKHAAD